MEDTSKHNTGTGSTDRRNFLKTSAGVAGTVLASGAYSSAAFAQKKDYPKLGNYPDGVSGDTVVAGLTLDLTGPYSAEGAGQRRGFELAAALCRVTATTIHIRAIRPGRPSPASSRPRGGPATIR